MCIFFLLLSIFVSSYARPPLFEIQSTTALSSKLNLKLASIPLHYRKASEVASILKQNNNKILSEQGSLIADDHSNQIWVYNMQDKLSSLKKIISAMDKPRKQISIAVKMMAIDTDALHSLGLNLDQAKYTHSNKETSNPIVDVKQLRWWLNHLDATISHGSGEMIASPTLLVSNHNTASIESGQEVPYQERTREGDTSTSFKSATLHLDVRPDLLPHQEVMLNIHLNQDKVSDLSVAGMPAIQTEKIDTSVRAKNHHTVILGGVYTHRLVRQIKSIPLLDRIPFLGQLFRHTYWLWQRQELMIFVTPSWS